jgi:hypothetical protein
MSAVPHIIRLLEDSTSEARTAAATIIGKLAEDGM